MYENIDSKKVTITHLVYDVDENLITLDSARNELNEKLNSSPSSCKMENNHSLLWDAEKDKFKVLSRWNSSYVLFNSEFLKAICKHILRNPNSVLQPDLYPNFQNKTMIEFGNGFFGSEINMQNCSDSEERWITDPYWSTTKFSRINKECRI